MYASKTQLPDHESLAAALRTILAPGGASGAGPEILDRDQNVHGSSLPSEFVTVRLPDGHVRRLFCKYTGSDFDSCHGHRDSVEYEGRVYEQLLGPAGVSAPRFVGVWGADAADASEHACLMIEALDDVARLTEHADAEAALVRAAGEVGAFQAAMDRRFAGGDWPAFLKRYDADFYAGWVRRTCEYAGPARHAELPWLREACDGAAARLAPLLAAPQTVVHGEMYPHNILCDGAGRVYLIDWQSAAVAPGEVDLASLTERWPDEIVRRCVDAYREARWPGGDVPPDHEATLDAARLYVNLRWLGDRPRWTLDERSDWRFAQLREQSLASR